MLRTVSSDSARAGNTAQVAFDPGDVGRVDGDIAQMIGLRFVAKLPGGVGSDCHSADRVGERPVTVAAALAYSPDGAMVVFMAAVVVMRQVAHVCAPLAPSMRIRTHFISF